MSPFSPLSLSLPPRGTSSSSASCPNVLSVLSGNVLGYRLLRPCVSCSISRPTYTTYASVVTNNDPASRGGEPRGALSAGGVTGGGVVDGLLFHFKLAAVTPVRRRIGIPPAEELPPPRSTWSDTTVATLPSPTTTSEAGAARGGDAAQQQQGGGSGRSRSALPARLREKPARVGDKMTWKHIPTAQVSCPRNAFFLCPSPAPHLCHGRR